MNFSAFEATPGISVMVQPDVPRFTLVAVSNDLLRFFNKKRQELVGKGLFEVLPQLSHDLSEIGAANLKTSFEYILKHKIPHEIAQQRADLHHGDGTSTPTYWKLSNAPVLDDNGEVLYIVHSRLDITEYAAAEKSGPGGQGLEKAYHFFMSTPVIIGFVKGDDYIIELANEDLLEVWGRTKEVIGQPMFRAIPELQEQGFKVLLDQVRQSGEPFYAYEYPITLLRQGKEAVVYFDFVYKPFYESPTDTKASGVIAVGYNVTDKVLSKRKIEESEAYFRRLTDTVPAAIWITEKDGSCSYLNQEWYELTGQAKEEALGFGWLNAAHPEDKAKAGHAFMTASANQTVYQVLFRLRLKDGGYRWIMDIGRPRYNTLGEFEGFAGFILDVHEQKQLETSLIESRHKWQQLANVVPTFVWTAGPDGAIDFLNEFWYNFTGLTEQESVGFGWAQVLHPDDAARCLAVWNDARKRAVFYEIETRYRSKEGHYRWVIARGVPIKEPDGKVVAWYGTSSDIHDQKMLTENLEGLVAERTRALQRSNEHLESFAHAASHDMKEPLRKIRTFADRIKSKLGPRMTEEEGHLFSRIEVAAERMQLLVDDLLEFSYVSEKQREQDVIDLNEKVRKVLADLELAIEEKGAQVVSGALPAIKGNRRQLQQLFYNLIGNALKYSKPGVMPVVRISARTIAGQEAPIELGEGQGSKSFHLIEVADNGIGFEPQYAGKIFEMFQRLHGKAEYAGTGVGLAIARKVVDNHGGYIWATSEPGMGSTFHVLLPADQAPS